MNPEESTYCIVGNLSPGCCRDGRILRCRPVASTGLVPGCQSRSADSPRAWSRGMEKYEVEGLL